MSISEHVNLAVAAFKQGDLARARHEAEIALKWQPSAPQILQLAGVICCQSGDLAQGAAYLRKAMQSGMDTPELRLNIARALSELGEFDEALLVCETAKAPNFLLRRMRADILKRAGEHLGAAAIYRSLLDEQPGDFEAWNNLGNTLHESGDFGGAITALVQARSISPATALIHLNLGRVFQSADRYEDSLAALSEAARLSPRDATVMLELGKCLRHMGKSSEALAALGTAARLDSKNANTFIALGQTFSDLADLAQAERAYRFALQADPRSAAAYLNLAILLEQANRIDELEALLKAATTAGAQGDEFGYINAMILRRQGNLADALQTAQFSLPDSLDPAIRFLFIGQVADHLGEIDTAFSAFEDMNRVTASYPDARRFDGTEHRRYVEDLLAATTPSAVEGWPTAASPESGRAPAFLLGFMRSGTTLLDTILMGHSGTHVLEEEPILAHIEDIAGGIERLGNLDERSILDLRARYHTEAAARGAFPEQSLLVDKNPLASLRTPLIHRLFPDARYIFTLRHPCDVVLSCFMQNLKINQAMASFLNLENAALLYDRVMQYWEACRSLLPLRIHTIRYEDMVENVEGEIRPLLEFLDLAWEDSVLDHQRVAVERGYIRTPSYAQVTESIYSRASGRWLRYRHHMEPVLPILAPWAEKFGYDME